MRRCLMLLALTCSLAPAAGAHCQIPCGIYGDQRRFDELAEDLTTIEKSIKSILELQGDPKANINQLVRWVTNKDAHAQKVQQTVLDYFLAQRIQAPGKDASKAARARYHRQLALLHQIVVRAMKCKQTTDAAHVPALRTLLGQFRESYFGKQDKQHLKQHHHGK